MKEVSPMLLLGTEAHVVMPNSDLYFVSLKKGGVG